MTIADKKFFELMRGERGVLLRQAANKEKADLILEKERFFYLGIWVVRILAFISDNIYSFLTNGKSSAKTFDSTQPEIFKDKKQQAANRKPLTINELQASRLLRDASLWD